MALIQLAKTFGLAAIIALSAFSGSAAAGSDKSRAALGYYDRSLLITTTGKAPQQVEPDQVTIQVKLTGVGEDVGAVVTALSAQKKELIEAAQGVNDNMASAQVISLDVRENRRNRRNKGNSKEAFQGTVQLSLSMKISGDPLALIAKVTNGRVEGISRTRFEVSDSNGNHDELKKQALADARKKAMEKAELLEIKLGRLVNVNYRETPRRSNYGNGATSLTVRATATFQRQDKKDD
ncbi:MAG: SIMPL domain-containing protein [Alphaproteobacteria bacterium]|nr:SIMPL domain-containing protein [Alphaproteobacteria bacterium]